MATENYKTLLYNYILKMKYVDNNEDNPNRTATVYNSNFKELEKYINNLRSLLIEVASSIDISSIVNDILSKLQTNKYKFDLNIDHQPNTTKSISQFGKTFTIERKKEVELQNGNVIAENVSFFIISGFEKTDGLIVQARLKTSNKILQIPIRFTELPYTIIVETFNELNEDISLIVL